MGISIKDSIAEPTYLMRYQFREQLDEPNPEEVFIPFCNSEVKEIYENIFSVGDSGVASGSRWHLEESSSKVAGIMSQYFPGYKFPCIIANVRDEREALAAWEIMQSLSAKRGIGWLWSPSMPSSILEHPDVYLVQKSHDGTPTTIHWRKGNIEDKLYFYLGDNYIPVKNKLYKAQRICPADDSLHTEYMTNGHPSEWVRRILNSQTDEWHVQLDGKNNLIIRLNAADLCAFHANTASALQILSRCDRGNSLRLAQTPEARQAMRHILEPGKEARVTPAAMRQMREALKQSKSATVPIMPTTDFESVAYADELPALVASETPFPGFTAGKTYQMRTDSYDFTEIFKRHKHNFIQDQVLIKQHECGLIGKDRCIHLVDDNGNEHRFVGRPVYDNDIDSGELWQGFNKPQIQTVKEAFPKAYKANATKLRQIEQNGGFSYYDGQRDYLCRAAIPNQALIAADVGCGKTLLALSLIQMKLGIANKFNGKALVVAPQGIVKDRSDSLSQWKKETHRFAKGIPVFTLTSDKDYQLAHKQGFPDGIYIGYYEALFRNGNIMARNFPDNFFDAIVFDECHIIKNPKALVTQEALRLQSPFRWALSATPLPNNVADIFTIMGWLSVDGWHLGQRQNFAWPYAMEDLEDFKQDYMTLERDYTKEQQNLLRGRGRINLRRNKAHKISPTISSPARLLKLIKPVLAFISKERCNSQYKPAKIHDVRLGMSAEQAERYRYFSDIRNVPGDSAFVRAGKQVSLLREIAAGNLHCGGLWPYNHQNWEMEAGETGSLTPKILAALEIIADIIKRGEQVVVISSRIQQSDLLHHYLRKTLGDEAISRIDSTTPKGKATSESQRFKDGETKVMLMGIKCAVGHSFSKCPNAIIMSIEFSYGPYHQAKGRVDRVDSERQANIHVLLHQNTIEEIMFDQCATKQDAATLCLHGKQIPRDFHTVSPAELLAAKEDAREDTECPPTHLLEEQLQPILHRLVTLANQEAWTKATGDTTRHPTPMFTFHPETDTWSRTLCYG